MQWPKLPIRRELIDPNYRNVRFGSKGDQVRRSKFSVLFDYLIRNSHYTGWNSKTEHLGGLEIDH